MTLGLIQMKSGVNCHQNLKHAISKIKSAKQKGAQIVCLQELFLTHYFPQEKEFKYFEFAEKIPGPTTQELSKVAKANKIVLIAPIFEKAKTGVYYNSVVVFNTDGALLGTYRKMHIPYDPGFYEKFYFSPGNLGFKVFKTVYGKIGVFICWDQWFPEGARLAALEGADILFYPTAIGWDTRRKDNELETERSAWQTIQRSHGIANHLYVAATNRVGTENNLRFWGSSFVSGPFGEMIAEASRSQEEILIATCDLLRIDEMRKAWPFFRDRRSEFYKRIAVSKSVPVKL